MGRFRQNRAWTGLILALFFFAGSFVGSMVKGHAGDVILTVNGIPITKDEFFSRLEQEIGAQVLQQMVAEALLLQEAAAHQIVISNEDIAAEVAYLKQNYPSEEAFEMALASYGLTSERLQEEIRMSLIAEALGTKDVVVDDEEIAEFFDMYGAFLGSPERINVSHILVQTEEEAQTLYDELRGGADFKTLAKTHSIDPGSKNQGGDLGLIAPDDPLVPEFKSAAFALELGEISHPVKSDYGYHIIQVSEKIPAKEATLEEERDNIRSMLASQQAKTFGDILDELLIKAKVDIRWERYQDVFLDRYFPVEE